MTIRRSRGLFNTPNRSWLLVLPLIGLTVGCPRSEPIDGPLPYSKEWFGCDRGSTDRDPLPVDCAPERGSDGIPPVRLIRIGLTPLAEQVCFGEDGTTGWIPPLEAKCSWAPGRRCELVPPGEKPQKPWEYVYPENEHAQQFKDAMGEPWKEMLEDASSMHMRMSWRSNDNECMFVFEAWGDADNDGSYAVDGVVFLYDREIENINHKVFTEFAIADEAGNAPHTRSPGVPFPMTINVFWPDPLARQIIDEYIRGKTDGTEFPEPLADYGDWLEKQM